MFYENNAASLFNCVFQSVKGQAMAGQFPQAVQKSSRTCGCSPIPYSVYGQLGVLDIFCEYLIIVKVLSRIGAIAEFR